MRDPSIGTVIAALDPAIVEQLDTALRAALDL
jgi:hypothetical protein